MNRRMLTFFSSLSLLAVLLVARPLSVQAWGPVGHQIVARIAEARLSHNALLEIRKILGEGQFSNEVTVTWADNIRIERKETGPWHYVNIPYDAKEYSFERDGREGKPGGTKHDIVERIGHFTKVLKDPASAATDKEEALKYLIHLLGDMHQPLHCADRNNDKGGNLIPVQFLKDEKQINLHKAWDIDLPKHTVEEASVATYAKRLNDKIKDEDVAAWTKGEVKDWAVESHDVAVAKVYADVPKEGVFQVDEKYIVRSKEVIDMQWQKAGVRLAFILDEIFK